MTELEKIAHARTYIDKLANGVNPLDGSVIDSDNFLNDPRMIRCLFYVSDVLRRVVAEGDGAVAQKQEVKKRKPKKEPIVITDEMRSRLAPRDGSTYAGGLVKMINDELSPDTPYFKVNTLNRWLVEIGAQTRIKGNKYHAYSVTEQGKSLGMYETMRNSRFGSYVSVMFSPEAQQFVFDNIDALVARQGPKKLPERYLAAWEEKEEDELIRMYESGIPVKEIAAELQRTKSAIRARLKMLGLWQQDAQKDDEENGEAPSEN